MLGGLTRRTIVAGAVLAVIVGAAFAFLLRAVERERTSARLARHSEQVLGACQRLDELVLDLESGQRGFSITGDSRFLGPWREARRAVPSASAEFVRLTMVPEHKTRAVEIAAMVRAYVRDSSTPLVEEAQRRAPDRAPPGVPVTASRREDAIRAQFDRFAADERRFAEARGRLAVNDARDAQKAAIGGLAGSVVLVLLFAGYFTRSIVLPVRRAAAMAGRLAEGDLATRMPETGPGEIGALQHAFNAMGVSLETSRDELRLLLEEQGALRRVATLVAEAVPPEHLLAAVVEEVDEVLGASSTRLTQFRGETMIVIASSRPEGPPYVGGSGPAAGEHIAGRVYRTGRPARCDMLGGVTGEVEEWLRCNGIRSMVGAPIVVAGRLWGTMVAQWTDRIAPPDTEERLEQFTDLVATAIANADSRAELTASRARVIATADETRRRIERDLHDGAQQRLVHTIISLKLARRTLRDGQAAAVIEEALDHAERANAALRELVQGILPAALDRGGLRGGVEALVARAPLPIAVDVTNERLPPVLEATAYFIVAEALTNVIKHANATKAAVTVCVDDDALHLEVRDDGAGGACVEGSTGLLGLHDRAAAVEGELRVESRPGGGTRVAATLPLARR